MYWGYKLKKESCQSMHFSNSGNVHVKMPIHTNNPEFNIFTQTLFFLFQGSPKVKTINIIHNTEIGKLK